MSDKKQKRVLGRGLDALLNSDDKNDTNDYMYIYIYIY